MSTDLLWPTPQVKGWNQCFNMRDHVDDLFQNLLAGEFRQARRHLRAVATLSRPHATPRNGIALLLLLSCTWAAPRSLFFTSIGSILLYRMSGKTGERGKGWLEALPQQTRDLWLKLGIIFAATSIALVPSRSKLVLSSLVSMLSGLSIGHHFLENPSTQH